jgi:hypothetical protein
MHLHCCQRTDNLEKQRLNAFMSWSGFRSYIWKKAFPLIQQLSTPRQFCNLIWLNVTDYNIGSIPDGVIGFFNWPNPSSRTMALGSTQPLTEMSTRNLPGGKGRPAGGADNLTAICEPTVYKMWEPRCRKTLCAFTACYRDSFTLFLEVWKSYDSPTWIKFARGPENSAQP